LAYTFINGSNLHYKIYGSGVPIIFVHGLGGHRGMWDLQVREFSGNYQAVVYDLRGHGQSESPDRPYSIDFFADELHHLLHFLGLKKSIVLGLSLGGRILLRFALKYPTEIRALILADAQSEIPEESKQRLRRVAEFVQREGMEKAAEVFFSLPLLQGLAESNPERFQKEKAHFAKSSAVGFVQSCLAIAKMEPLIDRLSAIKAPTLVLAGEKDEPYLAYLDLYARQIPNCKKQIVPRAGHVSNLENPGIL
jgi:3-oxoadipate enol-lactonase